MALQGEGDPRWVVRQRQDGRNVNGWHWEDKDVSAWAKERIKELLADPCCTVQGPGDTNVAVEKVESVDGDATLYNRKGVLKVLYDLKVSGKWTTDHEEKDDRTHGEFKFELFDEDPDLVVTVDSKSKGEHLYKSLFVEKVGIAIRDQCRVFIKEMHAGAGQSLEGVSMPVKKKVTETKATDYLRSGMNEPVRTVNKSGRAPLVLRDVFVCSTDDMYAGLTERARLEAITRARAVSEAKVGGKVNLLNGAVTGEYVELERGEKVRMSWKLNTWGKDADDGIATMKIWEDEESRTCLEVTVEGVPDSERSSTEGFWRVQIFQAMKVVMGWGSASQFL